MRGLLTRHARLVGGGALVAGLVGICASFPLPGVRPPSQAALDSTESPYPKARWRLVPFTERDNVVLWLSHILIRHRGGTGVSVLRGLWRPDDPSDRSVPDALRLARRIQREAVRAPDHFATLARDHSEDPETASRGGRYGGLRASQLPSAFLDALAVLKPGEVSEVIHSSLGYHIVRREPRPPAQPLAGQRIVVQYASTGMRMRSTRSRQEALSLAHSIVERARGGADFASLVARYSEDPEPRPAGDMGVWSSVEPGHNGTELDVLSNLALFEVSDPLDSRHGIQILRRIEPDEREAYAATWLRVTYDATAPEGDTQSRAQRQLLAESLLQELAAGPGTFASLQEEHCCTGVDSWGRGQRAAAQTEQVAKLQLGQVARTLRDEGWCFSIARRLDPAALPSAEVSYELPNPKAPDLDWILSTARTEALPEFLALFTQEVQSELVLTDAERSELAEAHQEARAQLVRVAPSARGAVLLEIESRLRDSLGESFTRDYIAFRNEWIERVFLESM